MDNIKGSAVYALTVCIQVYRIVLKPIFEQSKCFMFGSPSVGLLRVLL